MKCFYEFIFLSFGFFSGLVRNQQKNVVGFLAVLILSENYLCQQIAKNAYFL